MADVTIEVRGLRELGQKFKQLDEDIQKRISRAATNAGAQVVKRIAQTKVPVDTGNLKRNIIVRRLRPGQTDLTSEHIVTVRKGKLTAKQTTAGLSDAYYASFVEFGTVKTPPQPFLRPAIDQGKQQAAEAIKERLRVRIERANR